MKRIKYSKPLLTKFTYYYWLSTVWERRVKVRNPTHCSKFVSRENRRIPQMASAGNLQDTRLLDSEDRSDSLVSTQEETTTSSPDFRRRTLWKCDLCLLQRICIWVVIFTLIITAVVLVILEFTLRKSPWWTFIFISSDHSNRAPDHRFISEFQTFYYVHFNFWAWKL